MAIFHKYPYTDIHDLNLDWLLKVVKEMKDKFDSIDFDYIFNTLTELQTLTSTHTGQIAGLQDAIDGIGRDILQLQSDLESQGSDIESLQSSVTAIGDNITNIANRITTIEGNIRDIEDDIADLQSQGSGTSADISALESDVDSLDTRVTTLEDATIGQISVSPVNGNYSYDMHNLAGVDYAIETISGTGSNVTVGITSGGWITFHKYEDGYVKKQLRLKNFLSNLTAFDNNFSSLQVNFALCYQLGGLEFNKYVEYVNGTTVSQLLSGYTGGTFFTRIKLEANSTNKSYDLIIDCNNTTSAYWIQLEYLFVTLGSAVISQTTMRNYVGTPTSNLLALIKKNAPDYSADISQIQSDITTINTEITALESEDATLSAAINSLDSATSLALTDLDDRVDALESSSTVITNINDFLTDLPQDFGVSNVLYFRLYKVGKLVHLEMMLVNIPFNSSYGMLKLGTIRSAMRSEYAPADQTFFGDQISYHASWNGHDWVGDNQWGVNTFNNEGKRMNMVVCGSQSKNYIRNITAQYLDSYGIYLDVDDYSGTQMNSCIVNASWLSE